MGIYIGTRPVLKRYIGSREITRVYKGSQSIFESLNIATDLFGAGQQGAWYDPSDMTTLFQDVDGVTAVTAAGQPVRRMTDKSGRSNHMIFAGANPPTLQLGVTGALCLIPVDGTSRGVCAGLAMAQPITTCLAVDLAYTRDDVVYDSYVNNGSLYFSQVINDLAQAGSQSLTNRRAAPLGPCLVTVVHSGASTDLRIDGYSLGLSNGGTNGFAGLSLFNIAGSPNPFIAGYHSTRPFYGAVFRSGALSTNQIISLENYTSSKARLPNAPVSSGFAIGDSTVAEYLGGSALINLVGTTKTKFSNAFPGHTTSQQHIKWNQSKFKNTAAWAVIQVGLNDLSIAESTAATITRIQNLATSVKYYLPPTGKVFVSKMIPCRQRLIDLYGATNGPLSYQKWLDMNTAIAGGGATPITGVDGRITAHEPLMNDGSGNLLAAYDTGDHIHPNNAGRVINAQAWTDALSAAGVL